MSKKIGYRTRRRQYQDKYKRELSNKWFQYCKDPIENIEGWDKMLNDTSGQRWHLHHRDEIKDGVVVSVDELISRGEYYNLPASKLIFLTEFAHKSLHKTGEKHPMHGKTGKLAPGYGRTGELNPMYGRTGELNPCSKPIEIEGVKYCSRKAAAEALGKKERTIYNWVKQGKARYI